MKSAPSTPSLATFTSGRSSRLRTAMSQVAAGRQWPPQAQSEGGSSADFANYGYLTIHRPRQITADRQSQTRSFVGTAQRATKLHERLEDLLEFFLGDADSGVDDMDVGGLVTALTPCNHRPPLTGELHRIREEIEENLIGLGTIGERDAVALCRINDDGDSLRLSLWFDQRNHGLDHIHERSWSDVVGEVTCFDAAEVEQVRDDPHEVLLAVADSLQVIDLLRCDRTTEAEAKQLGVAADCVEWRAQLV